MTCTCTASPTGATILTIADKRFATTYELAEFPADGGRGFRLTKLTNGSDRTADGYDVFLANDVVDGEYDSCDCKGFQRAGRCKHITAVRDLTDRGFNAAKPVVPAPDRVWCDNFLTCGGIGVPGSGRQCDKCRRAEAAARKPQPKRIVDVGPDQTTF